jgi:hypothetical protein
MLLQSKRYLLVLLSVALLSFFGVPVSSAAKLPTPSATIPPTFFGMHVHRGLIPERWPKVKFHGWRLWDAFVSWPDLEPSKGAWQFDTLDRYVALAEKKQVEILLPLGLSPTWASARGNEPSIYGKPGYAAEPADLNDWRNYVRTVAQRYRGRIRHYEIWNEPNLKGFYTGSVPQMLTLAREAYVILKEVDPSIVVVSPSATGADNGPLWLKEYLAGGGGRYADIIGYHLYVSPHAPEAMVPLAGKVKSIMKSQGINKPLWNTEAGWGKNKTFANADEQAAYVARSFILNWASGVDRFYWYAWDNKDWTSLRMTSDAYNPTPAATAYAELQKWLVGAQMSSCLPDSKGVWSAQITRGAGYTGWIIWSDDNRQLSIPESWGVRRMRDLKGGRRDLTGSSRVGIGPSPLLLEK